ncbi:hypothetical protein D1AOALGA4SA_62 [Olavius algarvensis Delta 1 endosymbiont]|nr:hypothetical protein D1AOALGA4SA_62 [Olavius algarvensis Delta 1 endosymbiont]
MTIKKAEPFGSAPSHITGTKAGNWRPRFKERGIKMNKKLLIACTVFSVVVLLPFISLAASPTHMFVGDGATFTSLPVGGAWTTMMKVGPITAPGNGTCVVTASFTVPIEEGAIIQTTLATQPDARGPWVQVHQPGAGQNWESSQMVQAFVVAGGSTTTFYMNGQNLSASGPVLTENTRIFLLCAPGFIIPGELGASEKGEDELGN